MDYFVISILKKYCDNVTVTETLFGCTLHKNKGYISRVITVFP